MIERERKSLRLKKYDYSKNNYYFVTICTYKRQNFFGEIKNSEMILNDIANISLKNWLNLPNYYSNCFLDEFVFMPNHFHGIIIIDNEKSIKKEEEDRSRAKFIYGNEEKDKDRVMFTCGNDFKSFLTKSVQTKTDNKIEEKKIHGISEIIRAFKGFSTREINLFLKNRNLIDDIQFKWHKSFYDRIIRNEKELENVRKYIKNNPLKWEIDIENSKEELSEKKSYDYYEKNFSSEN